MKHPDDIILGLVNAARDVLGVMVKNSSFDHPLVARLVDAIKEGDKHLRSQRSDEQ